MDHQIFKFHKNKVSKRLETGDISLEEPTNSIRLLSVNIIPANLINFLRLEIDVTEGSDRYIIKEDLSRLEYNPAILMYYLKTGDSLYKTHKLKSKSTINLRLTGSENLEPFELKLYYKII